MRTITLVLLIPLTGCFVPHPTVSPLKASFTLDPAWEQHGEATVLAIYQGYMLNGIDYPGPSPLAVRELLPNSAGRYHVPLHWDVGFSGFFLCVPMINYQWTPVVCVLAEDGTVGFDSDHIDSDLASGVTPLRYDERRRLGPPESSRRRLTNDVALRLERLGATNIPSACIADKQTHSSTNQR